MAPKTWFLPPGFTFLPDGELRLGTVLKYPDRPTLALASLDETPAIGLPEVQSITEPAHAHSVGSGRSAGANLFAKAIDLASASGHASASHYQDHSFGPVDQEVRLFRHAPSTEALRAIINLEAVQNFINGGPFGRFRKRPVYLISGLRVAKDSFAVASTAHSTSSAGADVTASATALGAPVPLEAGGGIVAADEAQETHSYQTAPGVVFAYCLHVIRAKAGTESELFSHPSAFFTGGDAQEMELAEVTGESVQDVDEYSVGDDALIVFKE